MDTAFLITTFITLLVVIDPLALTPMFIAITQGIDARRRRIIAVRACLTAAGILITFALLGEALLGFIGISMPAFRIAGGILLFLTALDMLSDKRTQKRRERTAEAEDDDFDDPSVFPLAIPLLAGPGAITTVILLVAERPDWFGFAWVIGLMLFTLGLVFVSFLSSNLVERALGKTGINVTTRLLGMLLAALAVQFVLDGLRSFGLAG
ncbi:MAG: MarC family protein [Roseovarius sp.]